MVTHLCLGVVILALFATTVTHAEITVSCEKESVKIRWVFSKDWLQNSSRLFLGSCRPSYIDVLPSGEGEAEFDYPFTRCNFKKQTTGKRIILRNELAFKPFAKRKDPVELYQIECVYKRQNTWMPQFLNPGVGFSEGRGRLVFHMVLLNEHLSAKAKANVFPLGSLMRIGAAVEQKHHQPLLLLMEECMASSSPNMEPGSQMEPIVTNKGCLVSGNSKFLRFHSASIVLQLQAFRFNLGAETYIHCKLSAWDPEAINEEKKACHYVTESQSWELVDDPSRSSLCSCCSSTCKARFKRGLESHSTSHYAVLGPLIIVDKNVRQEASEEAVFLHNRKARQ